ncbi:MAG: CoA pyrophosphatase [Hyphomicrobiales bacterium]
MSAIEDFRARAARRLLREPPASWDRSDDDMNQKARMIPEGVQPRQASVLVPVVMRPQGLTMLLTQRTEHLSKHAGQIAFPGGRREAGESALETALRETEEETGLARSFVEPIGFLDGYLTVTQFLVTPVVALVREGFSLKPDPNEVADVFEVPLAFLMQAANCERHAREFRGATRHYYVYPWQNRYIWGATAGMIRNMGDRLYGEDSTT